MRRASEDAEDFLIGDPLGQPGVVEEVGAGISPTHLLPVGYYAETEVRCSFCPQRQRHKRGYFAVLPIGALALCGNCCAVRGVSQETVDRIDRTMEKRIAAVRRKARRQPLTTGLAELIELLDAEVLLTESQAFATLAELRRAFPIGIPVRPNGPMIAKGRGGLAAVLKVCENMTDAHLPTLWGKRRAALDLIDRGLDQIGPLTGIVSPRGLKTSLWYFSERNEYLSVTLEDGAIVALKGESGGGIVRIPLKELSPPDIAVAKTMVARLQARDPASGDQAREK